jgi:glycosyltransferase involved in cell wall biosynthesis
VLSSDTVKFSIITPSYNQGQFLEQTIRGVVEQQGNFDIEYFIYDGGSSDNSVSIIKKYAKKYNNIIWRSHRDNGQVDALNQALSKTTGDIVAYINSDDYYLPGTFTKVHQYFKRHPKKHWLVGNCFVSDPKLRWTFFLKHIWPIHIFKNALLVFNTINQPSVFIRRPLIMKIGKFDQNLHYAFDYDYWLRCNSLELPGRILHNLSFFRVHPNSKGNQYFHHQFDEDWLVFIRQNPNNFLYLIHAFARNFVKYVYKFLK